MVYSHYARLDYAGMYLMKWRPLDQRQGMSVVYVNIEVHILMIREKMEWRKVVEYWQGSRLCIDNILVVRIGTFTRAEYN